MKERHSGVAFICMRFTPQVVIPQIVIIGRLKVMISMWPYFILCNKYTQENNITVKGWCSHFQE